MELNFINIMEQMSQPNTVFHLNMVGLPIIMEIHAEHLDLHLLITANITKLKKF